MFIIVEGNLLFTSSPIAKLIDVHLWLDTDLAIAADRRRLRGKKRPDDAERRSMWKAVSTKHNTWLPRQAQNAPDMVAIEASLSPHEAMHVARDCVTTAAESKLWQKVMEDVCGFVRCWPML